MKYLSLFSGIEAATVAWKPHIGVYGASSLSTMIYAANEAQWDGTLNICTHWINNDY